ncbi:hypothetical protein [Streptomyces sp. IB2014 016-6]|uniref:hypothetical protein n=1 Tax=Streptomyces sp. IB2014 016-6 TaxID=2517818 RepID=UPI0011C7DD0F|nr:hypothetical protein [Streptomyces sp. IB2014 016-6]TXL92784.1 hypothetical protein EW053_02110 [Streptomyces sp. IB2014 016-6]
MSRKKSFSRKKKIALLVGAVALVGGTAVAMTGTSQASVECDGLNTALANNQRFIDGQRAAPDALSDARIKNRQDVIEEIRRKQAASGCQVGASDTGAAPPAAAPPAEAAPPAGEEDAGQGAGNGTGAGSQPGPAGEVVCAGSTVTLSGEAGAPAASSNEFPVGTTLKVTNLDNDRSTTVRVTAPSGSCALLNDAAFEQVREPGKFLIRNARIERVG